jgi:hypothetical protein
LLKDYVKCIYNEYGINDPMAKWEEDHSNNPLRKGIVPVQHHHQRYETP